MPDKDGNVKGISVPAKAWERVFGKRHYQYDEVTSAPLHGCCEHRVPWAEDCDLCAYGERDDA